MDPYLEKLRSLLDDMASVLVCYSGGVDSAFVLAIAHEVLGNKCVGMTAVSPSLAPFEKEAAIAIAKQIGARHELVESHEIDDPSYRANASDRCFHCKSELYRVTADMLPKWGLSFAVNGTNIDDLGDYRPGLEAARQAGVRSPLVECGFRKEDVRRCAALVGLSIWDKPASACLSSRIPYGTEVTRERLAQIAMLEAELRTMGLRQVRVRWHDTIARIEVACEELATAFDARDAVVAAGKHAGFKYVTLDLQGYRTGSHNEVLVGKSLRVV
jgi:uncharacterized protein